MDLGQLEAFVKVAEHKSFSRAAEVLFLTQPSVTARIQALEKELGESVFERNGRGVRLTDVGISFLPYVERVLQTLNEGKESLEELRNGEIGTLRIGAAPAISTYVLPKILKKFHNQHPRVDISVHTGHSDQVLQMVLTDEVQVGLQRTLAHPEVTTLNLYNDEVILVTSPNHPFASKESVKIEEVGRQPIIFFDNESSYYLQFQDLFLRAGVIPNKAMELDSVEASKKMVEEGLGIALLPKVSVEREVAMGLLVEVAVTGITRLERPISLIYRNNRKRGRTVQSFLEVLQQIFGFSAP